MMNSPKVIFNIEKTNLNKFSNMTLSQQKAMKSYSKNMFEYYSDEMKRAVNLFDYYTGKINKEQNINLMIEDGTYATKNEIESRKINYPRYIEKSHLWRCVISFDKNEYVTENIKCEELQKRIMTKIFPRFLKNCGFDKISNISYQSSLHTDTDNLHFHISFLEKKPSCKVNGKYKYRVKYKLPISAINYIKKEISHEIERNSLYTDKLIETNKEIDHLKKYFNPNEKNFLLYNYKDLLLEEKLSRLHALLTNKYNSSNSIKYNSIKDKEIVNLTKEVKNILFKDKNFQKDYKKFKKALNELKQYFQKYNETNNIKILKDERIVKRKLDYLDTYILNSIVNNTLKVTEDEIIKKIVKKDLSNNSKKDFLEYMYSNKKINIISLNKSKIENAIRKTTNEMERVIYKYQELFIDDTKIYKNIEFEI